ncbi:energy transducer TonB [Flagellatimonas centrodinii]|uniref:energy transducer TonB n=1 Tax=Flagellatimonas centrodinii TaxID=2806210 RepID=UPI001FED4138|nr:energy transducer TonB [Flagellatimonas centrodinii]ULQ47054.1 energy transducer TonB [Flagellatimonas centrodinii]
MNVFARFASGLPGAFIVTTILFLILAAMISQRQDIELSEDRSVDINVTRQLQDTSIQQQQEFQRPVLDEPPPPPPSVTDNTFRPSVSAQIGEIPDFSQAELDIGTGFNPDRDAQPMVRIPPRYPDMCQSRAKSFESVVVEFDVTPEGAVVNARVLDTTNACFERAALRAVERWKYQPKIVDNQAQPRFGVRTQITFQLGE